MNPKLSDRLDSIQKTAWKGFAAYREACAERDALRVEIAEAHSRIRALEAANAEMVEALRLLVPEEISAAVVRDFRASLDAAKQAAARALAGASDTKRQDLAAHPQPERERP